MITDFAPPDSDSPIDWALAYVAAGMAVFPGYANKVPLVENGFKDASTDEAIIRGWWRRWPHADPAWAVPAPIVVVDLDCKNGIKDFVKHEGAHPDDVVTPQASSPTGGRHLVHEANGTARRNVTGLNGWGIDLRTVGGYIVLSAGGNGRAWIKPLSTPLAPSPKLIAPTPTPPRSQGAQRPFARETAYAAAALKCACLAIEEAPAGQQETTLNRECFSVGGLVGAGELDAEAAIAALTAAADLMPQYAEPWRDLDSKVSRALKDGMRQPREHSGGGVSLGDFVAYMQTHDYVFMPAGDFWPAARIDARLPPVKLLDKNGAPIDDPKTGEQKQISASRWLAKIAPVEQLTWCPGLPQLVRQRLVSAGGWVDHKNATVLNLYRPRAPRPATRRKPSRGSRMSDGSIQTKLITSSVGSHTGCRHLRRRSTTDWCSAAPKALARTRCWSRSSARSGHGTSLRCRRRTCLAGSMAS